MTTPSPAEIVKGLSEAQREALAAFDGFDYEASNQFRPPRGYPQRRTVQRLCDLGLYARVPAPKSHANHAFICFVTTPLGEQVRAALLDPKS